MGSTMDCVKACSVCRSSRTPLWRNGPEGPKSLCNACGIKYRKRKRREEKKVEASRRVAVRKSGDSASARAAVLTVEEMKRMQREKQEKMLLFLLRERSKMAESCGRRWTPVGMDTVGCSREVAEAALLLLSLSYGYLIRS